MTLTGLISLWPPFDARTIFIVAGPYRVVAQQAFIAGSAEAQGWVAGSVASEGFASGTREAQGWLAGTSQGQAFIAGTVEADSDSQG